MRRHSAIQAGRAVAVVALVLSTACSTSVHLTPTLAATARADCRVFGHLSYAGNPEYLPPVLADDATRPADAVLRYSHEQHYGLSELPGGVQIVNPLHLAGFPTGESSLTVVGRLDVMRGGAVVRSFAAAAAMKRSQSMFSEGETFTELRRRGLLLVRDNVAAQVCADVAAMQAILDAAHYAPEAPTDTP